MNPSTDSSSNPINPTYSTHVPPPVAPKPNIANKTSEAAKQAIEQEKAPIESSYGTHPKDRHITPLNPRNDEDPLYESIGEVKPNSNNSVPSNTVVYRSSSELPKTGSKEPLPNYATVSKRQGPETGEPRKKRDLSKLSISADQARARLMPSTENPYATPQDTIAENPYATPQNATAKQEGYAPISRNPTPGSSPKSPTRAPLPPSRGGSPLLSGEITPPTPDE